MKRSGALTALAVLAACGGGEPASEPDTQAEMTAAPEAAMAEFDAEGAYQTVCATCHGATGAGDGPAGAALDPKPADFSDPTFWDTRTDEEVFTVIKEGGPAVGKSPIMVGWSLQYDDEQINALVEYLKTLRAG